MFCTQHNFKMSDSIKPLTKRRRLMNNNIVASNWPLAHEKMDIQHPDTKPADSLMLLPDDCLRRIFEYSDTKDLCWLADVCSRTRPIAEETFRKRYRKKQLKNFEYSESMFRRILCKFGDYIISLDVNENAWIFSQNDAQAMANYCKNLKQLKLYSTFYCDEMKSLMPRLKRLDIDFDTFVGDESTLFTTCTDLEYLRICNDDNINIDFIAKKFPKLVELDFHMPARHIHTFDNFEKLLILNPQLKQLSTTVGGSQYFSTIAQHSQNLEELKINYRLTRQTEGLLELGKLTKLKKLYFDAWHVDKRNANLVAPLMTAFAMENVALEHLHLRFYSFNSNDIDSILKFKTLKTIKLSMNRFEHDNDLISLTTDLPLLTELRLSFGKYSRPISASVLNDIVRAATHLSHLEVHNICNTKIDVQEFGALMEAASLRPDKQKLTIKIVSDAMEINVPLDIQRKYRHQLEIIHKCNCKSRSHSQ